MGDDDTILSERECELLIADVITISSMALAVSISLRWPSAMPQEVSSRLRRVIDSSIEFYRVHCRRSFDSNSVSFSFVDSNMSVDAQHSFQSRIEGMIHSLSSIQSLNAANPETISIEERNGKFLYDPPRDAAVLDTVRVSKSDISALFVQTVQGFCRSIIVGVNDLFPNYVPMTVQDLILFLYAKPMRMSLKRYGKDSFEIAWICPILGDWDYVKEHILDNDDKMQLHMILNNADSDDTKRILDDDWDSFYWNEMNDLFVTRKFIKFKRPEDVEAWMSPTDFADLQSGISVIV